MELKRRWEMFFSENTKQILFAMIPFSYFGWISIQLFLNGEADWFSRLGSAIVAWAIISIAVSREKYSQFLWRTERKHIVDHLNKQTDMREMMGDSISLTFDLHATQIVQISHELGKSNPFVENKPDEIKEFCLDVERRLKDAPWVEKSNSLLSETSALDEKYRDEIKIYSGWQTLFWRLEVALLVWGTIQWGYGDSLVNWWSSYFA